MSTERMTSESLSRDNLLAGEKVISRSVTLLSGENRSRGALLGKITKALGTTIFSGTGNGAMSGQALGAKAQIGNYTVKCIIAAANGGTFKVIAPNGERLDDAVVGSAYSGPHIGFTIADGTTDFIVGDTFTVPVAAGSGKHKLSLAAAVDGSQDPEGILVENSDASGGDLEVGLYIFGEFNENALTFGTGHTAASVKDGLRDKGIYLKPAVTA